ncbi:MAG: class I SAM-dependent methyltransferase [Planctomycetaceae bacterium]
MPSPSRKKSRGRKSEKKIDPELRTSIAEELLEEQLSLQPPTLPADPVVLCTSLGRGQIALSLASQIPGSHVTCCAFDSFLAEQMQAFLDQFWVDDDDDLEIDVDLESVDEGASNNKIEVLCAADFPERQADMVVIPVKKSGDGELTRDWLQTGVQRLKIGGQLWTAVDHPRDHWLHEELKRYFPKVKKIPAKKGVTYIATKTKEIKKVKNFRAEFAFRDQGRMIQGVTRPGVFCHRRVDAGARAIMSVMEIAPGNRVADIGCGSGAVGMAAALRHPDVTVLAIDSNPRALECTQRGAEINGITNIVISLNADAVCEPQGEFDVVVGNPPYYSNYRIAEIFLQGASRALRPGGRVWMVTKQPNWFVERMSEMFDNVNEIPAKGYSVIVGTKAEEG